MGLTRRHAPAAQGYLVYSPGPECQHPPEVFRGQDAAGRWRPYPAAAFTPEPFEALGALAGSIRSMLACARSCAPKPKLKQLRPFPAHHNAR